MEETHELVDTQYSTYNRMSSAAASGKWVKFYGASRAADERARHSMWMNISKKMCIRF